MKLRHLILEKIVELGEGMLDAFSPAHYSEARLLERKNKPTSTAAARE